MIDRVEKAMKNLESKKIPARYFETKEDASRTILEEISPEETVGIGGSMTIKAMGLYEALTEAGNEVYWHWMVEPENRNEVTRKAAFTDVYLSSTNALTEGGELVNIDGVGNRVSGMYFGHKKVIIVCGINKLCGDVISAIDRIKQSACPQNARRLNLKTPCALTDECNDCLSPERMCNITTIINHKPRQTELKVYIIGEELGY
jgi:hypothetical protein